MNRSDLINRISKIHSQLLVKDAELAVKVILDSLTAALIRGERVVIRGFGSFVLNYHPPHQGRNPKMGDQVELPAKYLPYFKAGKELREQVNLPVINEVYVLQ